MENLPGPLLYTNTTTRDGRQNLFDANAITYNDLDKSVITNGYIANSLRVSAGYHFGGEAAEPPLVLCTTFNHPGKWRGWPGEG
ncbi:hypothetical protein [Eubacterium aggregans]|uniref:hypothetical protein n=1 Tax=Eubacterium aggregans TaxID=81409 RepID=UPI003F3BA2BE